MRPCATPSCLGMRRRTDKAVLARHLRPHRAAPCRNSHSAAPPVRGGCRFLVHAAQGRAVLVSRTFDSGRLLGLKKCCLATRPGHRQPVQATCWPATSLVKARVVEIFIFREKAFLTRQAVVELRPGMLMLGKHMDLGPDRLRIVQRTCRDAIVVCGAMKSERATAAWTEAAPDVLRRSKKSRFAAGPFHSAPQSISIVTSLAASVWAG